MPYLMNQDLKVSHVPNRKSSVQMESLNIIQVVLVEMKAAY